MNMFSVLESDEEDDEVVPAPLPTPPPKKATTAPAPAAPAPKAEEPRKNNAPPRPRKTQNSSAAPLPAEEEVQKPTSSTRSEHREGGRGGRGGGRRHGSDYDAEGSNRKRQYERHSGTGRGREVSKDGAGGHNWGNEKVEALNAEKGHIVPIEEVAIDAPKEEGWGTDDAQAPADAVPESVDAQKEPEPEPEIPTYTLDEYLKKREVSRVIADSFGPAAERTVNKEEFAGLKTKEGDLGEFMALGGGKTSKTVKKDQRSTNAKVQPTAIELGFTNASLQQSNGRDEGRGGRGGRGRGREGGDGGRREDGRGERPPREFGSPRDIGGRGRGRGGRGSGSGVNIFDASAFPSL